MSFQTTLFPLENCATGNSSLFTLRTRGSEPEVLFLPQRPLATVIVRKIEKTEEEYERRGMESNEINETRGNIERVCENLSGNQRTRKYPEHVHHNQSKLTVWSILLRRVFSVHCVNALQ